VRDILAQVMEFWFFERFRGLTAKEVWAMLNLVIPIQETKAYQSIFAEGKATGRDEGWAEGEVEGKGEGKAEDLKRLLKRRFNTLPPWVAQRIDAASIAQLDAWLEGIFAAPSLEALIGSAPN
jgi:predicted transposase YdaD